MGKAKRRSIAVGRHNQISNLSRNDAIISVVEKLSKQEDVSELITLFGLSAEELLEAGANYEDIKSLRGLV